MLLIAWCCRHRTYRWVDDEGVKFPEHHSCQHAALWWFDASEPNTPWQVTATRQVAREGGQHLEKTRSIAGLNTNEESFYNYLRACYSAKVFGQVNGKQWKFMATTKAITTKQHMPAKSVLWSVLPLSNIDIEADFLGSTVPGSSQPSKYKLGKS